MGTVKATDVWITDDGELWLGTDKDCRIGYDETTDNRIEIRDSADVLRGYYAPLTGALALGPDTNIESIFGRFRINTVTDDVAAFGHYDHTAVTGVGFRQTAAGVVLIGVPTGQGIGFRINNVSFMQITAAGVEIDSGSLVVEGGVLTAGVSATARGAITAFHGAAGNTPGYLKLHSPNGTAHYIFVEDDGTLKQHTAAPAANTDGNVVGAQT